MEIFHVLWHTSYLQFFPRYQHHQVEGLLQPGADINLTRAGVKPQQ